MICLYKQRNFQALGDVNRAFNLKLYNRLVAIQAKVRQKELEKCVNMVLKENAHYHLGLLLLTTAWRQWTCGNIRTRWANSQAPLLSSRVLYFLFRLIQFVRIICWLRRLAPQSVGVFSCIY